MGRIEHGRFGDQTGADPERVAEAVKMLETVYVELAPGDVLFFHSHTVHQGLPNRSGDRLRLSADFRYQRASEPVIYQVLTPHQGRLTWEEVYAGWKSDKYQYHWKKFTLTTVTKVPWKVD